MQNMQNFMLILNLKTVFNFLWSEVFYARKITGSVLRKTEFDFATIDVLRVYCSWKVIETMHVHISPTLENWFPLAVFRNNY